MDNVETFLARAREDTGLGDFGDESFLEGLETLILSLQREARLNAVGEQVLSGRILEHLKQRLQVEDWYHRHPEIDDVDLAPPLIGISLPRTGSTALSFLLHQDPNARSLLRDEAAEPCPPPGIGEGAGEGSAINDMSGVTGWRSHTPTGEHVPAECQDLMALDFKSQMFQAFAQVPSYSEWLLNADLTSTYHYERRVLKLLQWRCPYRPWRLKCPTHLIYLEPLSAAFPEARFVMTHRDPADVMLSVIDVYADIVSRFTDEVDMQYLADLNIRQWSEGMRRTLGFREDEAQNARFYDIHFRAMHEDPVGEITRLYQWLGEPVSEAFRAGMDQWWQENNRNREPAAARRAEDFGVDLGQVRALFADYTARIDGWTNRV